MRVVQVPADVLVTKAKTVTKFDNKLAKLVTEMIDTLKNARDPEGVGLAAVQVGVSKRLFVMTTNPENEAMPVYDAFINPEIVERSKTKKKSEKILEGCLSISNVWGYPERINKVKLNYQDIHGKKLTREFTGFGAIIVQHETDHLDGILFTHRVMEQGKELYQIDKDEKGEASLTPLEL